MMNVEPIVAPFVAEGGFALSDLVGVMGESVVYTAAVDIKILDRKSVV